MNIDHNISSVIFNAVDNGIIIVDKNLSILAWNKWLEIFTGKLQKDVINKNLCEMYDYINKKKLLRRINTVLITNNPTFYTTDQNDFLIDIPYNNITNSKFTSMQQNVTIVPFDEKNEQVAIFIYDHTALRETNAKLNNLNDELKELSNKDHLTGLYNRRFFAEESTRALSLSARNNSSLSVVMLDIDKFKNINDTYGHNCGDMVIISVANILTKAVRKSDIAARFGGEEFVLLLYETTPQNAVKVAENLRQEMEKTEIIYEDNIIKFTVSFGVSQCDTIKDSNNIEHTIVRADSALYEAKNSGRNKVCLAQ
jgi:diguanylate cyclase (GGDEF)-like protein